jgi:hypothetical protein
MPRVNWATLDDTNLRTAMSANVGCRGSRMKEGNRPRGSFLLAGFGRSSRPAEVSSWFGLAFTNGWS